MLLRVMSSRERQGGDNVEVSPKTYGQAVNDSAWRESMMDKIQALRNGGCWRVVQTPQGVRRSAADRVGVRLQATSWSDDGSCASKLNSMELHDGATVTYCLSYEVQS